MALDWFRHYTAWNGVANRQQYDAPADPWQILHVDPSDVEFLTLVAIKWGLGRVCGGEWDDASDLTPVRHIPAFEGFRQRFEDGANWEETAYYEMAENQIENRGEFRGCGDIEEFRKTNCRAIDDLFESVQQDGYRPNRGTIYDSPEDAESIHDLEPMVLIGRSGEIYWTEGFHRLVIAKLLDVETVPVYVLRRHEEWQRIRDEINGTLKDRLSPDLDAYLDHPDIQDIIS